MLAAPGLLDGCTPGPGQDPQLRDAQVVDAAPEDAGVGLDRRTPFDAGDAAVGVTDFGPPPFFRFSGVFGAFGGDTLVVREAAGRLLILVGQPPFVYAGSIGEDGAVRSTSPVLARSGCPGASLVGRFDRSSAVFELEHSTCGSDGRPLQSTLRGGFAEDFTRPFSGVYVGEVAGVADPVGCAGGLALDAELRWGIGLTSGGVATLATLSGVEDEARLYVGRTEPAGFSALTTIAVGEAANQVAATVRFVEGLEGAPNRIEVRRTVPRTELGCTFELEAELRQVEAP